MRLKLVPPFNSDRNYNVLFKDKCRRQHGGKEPDEVAAHLGDSGSGRGYCSDGRNG
jgi:hypothetical protein